ncbi:MAG: DUF308 domain-containing protein [Bacteroidales bacterium]|nr:DUF308 domain-containing protein [Bacteroidales bacterium]MBR2135694.1 DUF308 domain-containing protein [Bacteroidales bacterium]
MTETTKKGNGLAVAGFVLGILALVFSFFFLTGWLTWILAVLALIFGVIGCFGNRKNKGLAIIAAILAVASVCIYQFRTYPKYVNPDTIEALNEFGEALKNSANEATEEVTEAVENAAEETPAN